MTYEIGKFYKVPCVRTPKQGEVGYFSREYWRGEWVPALGPLHEDAEFIGFPHLHWHVDWRFASDRLFNRVIRSNLRTPAESATSMVLHLFTNDQARRPMTASAPTMRRMLCRREAPGPFPHKLARWMPRLEQAYSGQRLKPGLICPHRGIPLAGCPTVDGVVTCPAHGLQWNVATGELVPTIKVSVPCD